MYNHVRDKSFASVKACTWTITPGTIEGSGSICGYNQNHKLNMIAERRPGPRFNIKMSSYQYKKSHCGDKTVVR